MTGFRPSQQITFSPLTSTADSGAHWATGNVVAGLADVPDALAAAPGSGDLIALLPGRVELSRPGGSGWTTLARVGSVTDSAAGRARGPSGLTAVAFGPAGVPMAAGACAKAGTVGIFAFVGRHWQAAGPALPASLSGQLVTVLCLTTVGGQAEALASHRSLLTVWATGPASSGWAREQAINVPIQYSSSSLDRPPGRPMTWGCGICCRPAGRWTGSPSEGRQATKPPRLKATAMNAIGAQLQNPAITDTVHNGINQLARWPCDT